MLPFRYFAAVATLALAANAADFDLILYGATGCVGHLAAEHLAEQQGLKWAIADINATRLQDLLTQLKAAGGASSSPEMIVAPIGTDPATWVPRATAVATAAGPYDIHDGEAVVKACATHGVHYTDASDEFYWQREMIDAYHQTAEASGAKVVLSSGFCVLAGDLGSRLAIDSVIAAGAKADLSVDAWLETYNGGLSAGVINTGKAIKNATYPKEWNTDPYVLAPNASTDLRVDTLVDGTKYPKHVAGEGEMVGNIFGPYDARLLRRSFTLAGIRVQLRVGALPGMYEKWSAFLALHPGAWSTLAKCPTDSVLKGGSWQYRFKASAGSVTKTVLLSGGGDPGYHFTSNGLAEVGLCLAGKVPGCLRDGAKGGVYTSMSPLSASGLQQRLQSVGLVKVAMDEAGEEQSNVDIGAAVQRLREMIPQAENAFAEISQ